MTKITEKEFMDLYQRIRVTGVVWVVTINRGVLLKAKMSTELAERLFQKKYDTIVGCYDERIKEDRLRDDLEYFGAVIAG